MKNLKNNLQVSWKYCHEKTLIISLFYAIKSAFKIKDELPWSKVYSAQQESQSHHLKSIAVTKNEG